MVTFDTRVQWAYYLRNPYKRVLTEDFHFEIGDEMYIIKAGYYTDGASIPKAFWGVVGSPFTGKYVLAALIHDMLYATNYYKKWRCDEIFLEAMKQCGVSYVERQTLYHAVKYFGGKAYKAANKEIEGAMRHLEVTCSELQGWKDVR